MLLIGISNKQESGSHPNGCGFLQYSEAFRSHTGERPLLVSLTWLPPATLVFPGGLPTGTDLAGPCLASARNQSWSGPVRETKLYHIYICFFFHISLSFCLLKCSPVTLRVYTKSADKNVYIGQVLFPHKTRHVVIMAARLIKRVLSSANS